MRSLPILLASLALIACAASDRDGTTTRPLASSFNDPTRVDTVGLPDLIVAGDVTAQHWLVRDEKLAGDACSVIEGGVTAGTHRIIRFTVTTPNIGDADVYIGSPLAHVQAGDSLYEFAQCHQHFHFRHYATYRLIDPATGTVWKAAKRGFCMLDTDVNPPSLPGYRDGPRNYLNCGTNAVDGFQGISHGWSDTYVFTLGGQYFVLDGGDGQPPVPPGNYVLQIEVNPAYQPDKKGQCPRVQDPATGLCHQFAERDYTNNVANVPISIPSHPGRDGYGPLKGNTDPVTEVEHK
jgi:hypothetical protein